MSADCLAGLAIRTLEGVKAYQRSVREYPNAAALL